MQTPQSHKAIPSSLSSQFLKLSARQRHSQLWHKYLHSLLITQVALFLCSINGAIFTQGNTRIVFILFAVLCFPLIGFSKIAVDRIKVASEPIVIGLVAFVYCAVVFVTLCSPDSLPFTVLAPMVTLVMVMPHVEQDTFRKLGIFSLIVIVLLFALGLYTNFFDTHISTPLVKFSTLVGGFVLFFLLARTLQLFQIYLSLGLLESNEQSELFEYAANNAQEGMFITEGPTNALKIVFLNQAFEHIMGYTSQEAIGKSPTFFHGPNVGMSDLMRVYDLSHQQAFALVETLGYRKDGSQFWAECKIVCVKSDKAKTQRHVIFIKDITQRKQYEEDLERRVAERTQALNTALNENNRLHDSALRAKSLEERNRLARELHDSVSQAIFGAALAARTLQQQAADQPHLQKSVEFILQMSDSALKEMRALIFELRPETLHRDGLMQALKYQTEAMQARHLVTVAINDCAEPEGDLTQKEAIYRIAVEAIHNAGKHARATRIALTLTETPTELKLFVEDDGVGFNPLAEFKGHLGLKSMYERAVLAGGTFNINSQQGCTLVSACVPKLAAVDTLGKTNT